MLSEENDIDLNLLSEHFTECGDYTKDVILKELEYWKGVTEFLVLVSRNNDSIDGFLIGYHSRNSLWIAQSWRKSGSNIKTSRKAFEMAKEWAIERNLTSITGETDRKEMRAMELYGFKEESVNMKVRL